MDADGNLDIENKKLTNAPDETDPLIAALFNNWARPLRGRENPDVRLQKDPFSGGLKATGDGFLDITGGRLNIDGQVSNVTSTDLDKLRGIASAGAHRGIETAFLRPRRFTQKLRFGDASTKQPVPEIRRPKSTSREKSAHLLTGGRRHGPRHERNRRNHCGNKTFTSVVICNQSPTQTTTCQPNLMLIPRFHQEFSVLTQICS